MKYMAVATEPSLKAVDYVLQNVELHRTLVIYVLLIFSAPWGDGRTSPLTYLI